MRYRIKSPIVDAVQWNGKNQQEVVDLVDGGYGEVVGEILVLRNSSGVVGLPMNIGDWAVRRVGSSSIYMKSDRDFKNNYDPD